MDRRLILWVIIGVLILVICGVVSFIGYKALVTDMGTAIGTALRADNAPVVDSAADVTDQTSLSESDEIVSAETTTDAAETVVELLLGYEDTASAEAGLMSQYDFTREQAADFNGGMNHWTSGRGSCGSPDRDPQDPEYCRFRYLIAEDTLVAFIIDATGVYFENRDHVTEFIVTNEQPYSVKDGGLISLHATMDEQEVALAIVSRLFWANRPGMTRDDAVASGPTRTLAIRNETGR